MTLVLALVVLAAVLAARPAARALSRARLTPSDARRRAEQDVQRRATVAVLTTMRGPAAREEAVEVSDPALGAGCGRVVVDDGPWPVEVARERSRR